MTEIKDEQRYIEVFSMTDEECYRDALFRLAADGEDRFGSRLHGYAAHILKKAGQRKLLDTLKDWTYRYRDNEALFHLLIGIHDLKDENKDLRAVLEEIVTEIRSVL